MRNIIIGILLVLAAAVGVWFARRPKDQRPMWLRALFDPWNLTGIGDEKKQPNPIIEGVGEKVQGPGIDPNFVAPENVQAGRVKQLVDAFRPQGIDFLGTDEEKVYEVLSSLAGPSDFSALIQAYGIRGLGNNNLIAELRNELTDEEQRKADSILYSNGIRPVIKIAK
jgi:hypothetical protein